MNNNTTKYRYLYIILFLLGIFPSSIFHLCGQNIPKVKLNIRPYGDSVAIRWQLYDVDLWEQNAKKGYDIYRKEGTEEPVKINSYSVKALTPIELMSRYISVEKYDTSAKDWVKNYVKPKHDPKLSVNIDSTALKALVLLTPADFGASDNDLPNSTDSEVDFGNDPKKFRWMLHSVLCLGSLEATKISGLFYTDKKVKKGTTYTYYLVTAGDSYEKALAEITINSSDSYPIHAPNSLRDYTNKRRTDVYWKKADTALVWLPSYEIYRSEKKTGPYKKINAKPIYSIYSGADQIDSIFLFHRDNTLEKDKVYYYKVRGLDVFGEYTSFSEPYLVKEKTLLQKSAYIEDPHKVEKPLSATFKWVVHPEDEPQVDYFQIFHGIYPDSIFFPITEKLKNDTRSFQHMKPSHNNYYIILMVGKAGDSLWSNPPAYISIPDTVPPSPVNLLNATCDSNGVIKLKWKHNNEVDLKSFKIYRANYEHEEFSRIASIDKVDTIYHDTINLKILDKAVYYKILAYDDSYNPSIFSNIVKVKRYDILPPTPPVISFYRSGSEGIQLKWANSSSDDVIKTTLYKRMEGNQEWQECKSFATDTSEYTNYIDKEVRKGKWYTYYLQAMDENGLLSEKSDTAIIQMYDDGVRQEITSVKAKPNFKKKLVRISWEYKQPGVELFQVYRSNGTSDQWEILKSLPGNSRDYYDEAVGPGNEYSYRVRALYSDGGQSPFSNELKVNFNKQ